MTEPAPDRYVVVGHPVEHSRSPLIHQRFAEQTGERIEYGRLLAPLDGFAATVRGFAEGGGAGCNVTVPFKFEALQLARHRSERAALAQAANWLRFGPDGWSADNTDGAGLVRDITINAEQALAGCRLLLIGAGGAAAGVLGPLLAEGPGRVVVANRTADKAQALADRHTALAVQHGVELAASATGEEVARRHGRFDLIVNATSSSLSGAPIPVPGSVIEPGSLVIDMMYGPAAAGFLEWAARHGARGRDGLGMLVEQANEAFYLWRGVRPDSRPVLHELQGSAGRR